ncbi:MAG: cytochrome c maturation protein CcmE [Acidimicrobiales bacterium]|nr:cytochrome c maturation protein CcmE [Acidimicrobiales bacterium]
MSSELDLSPRDHGAEPSGGPRRSIRNKVIGGIVALALAFVLYQGLTNARVFFLNVDEAIEQRDDLGERTFRMQGTVVSQETDSVDGPLLFTVAYNDATAQIRHVGPEPSDLFDLGEPVVVEGHWAGDVFESDQIIVKHDESYVEDNPARLDYELDAQ